eukprot:scaffold1355_cov268-Pinguiococcus_pyrenoidosus.AAC.36
MAGLQPVLGHLLKNSFDVTRPEHSGVDAPQSGRLLNGLRLSQGPWTQGAQNRAEGRRRGECLARWGELGRKLIATSRAASSSAVLGDNTYGRIATLEGLIWDGRTSEPGLCNAATGSDLEKLLFRSALVRGRNPVREFSKESTR